MGCGGSKLKGDPIDNIGGEPSQPVKKIEAVQSRFHRVDYNASSDKRTSAGEGMAPHETAPEPEPTSSGPALAKEDEDKLEPYKTIG